jgi:hypothetical protein
MRIYVFQRPDGTYGADYSHEFASRNGCIRERHKVDTNARVDAVLLAPGTLAPARVRALAERARTERTAEAPPPVLAPIPASVTERGFWSRLKWALFRK